MHPRIYILTDDEAQCMHIFEESNRRFLFTIDAIVTPLPLHVQMAFYYKEHDFLARWVEKEYEQMIDTFIEIAIC